MARKMETARILIVGAGAAGGYIGAELIAAGRDVTFLVHPRTMDRLTTSGLRLRDRGETSTTVVRALTAAELHDAYDLIVIAIRANAVTSAIDDVRAAVGPDTRIVPIMNGMRHLSLLVDAFGPERVLGAATRLVTSMTQDGVIEVVTPGIEMQIGQLDGSAASTALQETARQLDVANIEVTIRSDVVMAMWEKFAFIASTAVLTCLIGDEVGPIARAEGGIPLARGVLGEVAAVAAARGYALDDATRAAIEAVLTDTSSTFGPSMFRDMHAGRTIEISVLADLADLARRGGVSTPLLDASMVAIDVHNRRVG